MRIPTFAFGWGGFADGVDCTGIIGNALPGLNPSGAGRGDATQGDFAYAFGARNTSYGLVGWMAKDHVFALRPLQQAPWRHAAESRLPVGLRHVFTVALG